ncbi:DUF1127 domain-containing protein [Acidimangrovimonas sediminis]|uniref:DUF1127 domain-containing protein n=1 Tax=Acidimangrovimonas sediminis TaxID=2056283 RepID=UPI000C7FEA3D|nr:DUF1127 domain-containing protein [Acidimangrovimonas sediminis]
MMTSLHTSDLAVRGVRTTDPFSRLVHIVFGAFVTRRDRARLAELDDALLNDIGITRHEAMIEARRPLWDVPAHWKA